jgi:hypothetical protein
MVCFNRMLLATVKEHQQTLYSMMQDAYLDCFKGCVNRILSEAETLADGMSDNSNQGGDPPPPPVSAPFCH